MFSVMICQDRTWLGPTYKRLLIITFLNVYGENEWGNHFLEPDRNAHFSSLWGKCGFRQVPLTAASSIGAGWYMWAGWYVGLTRLSHVCMTASQMKVSCHYRILPQDASVAPIEVRVRMGVWFRHI